MLALIQRHHSIFFALKPHHSIVIFEEANDTHTLFCFCLLGLYKMVTQILLEQIFSTAFLILHFR